MFLKILNVFSFHYENIYGNYIFRLLIVWSPCQHDFFLRILSAPFCEMVFYWLMKSVSIRIISWIGKWEIINMFGTEGYEEQR
jgi:hypothetical protein